MAENRENLHFGLNQPPRENDASDEEVTMDINVQNKTRKTTSHSKKIEFFSGVHLISSAQAHFLAETHSRQGKANNDNDAMVNSLDEKNIHKIEQRENLNKTFFEKSQGDNTAATSPWSPDPKS